jgi:hypothetical protein
MQTAVFENITSGVNERRFLEHLKNFFSSSTIVLAEAMQNARRAGASAVHFDYSPNSSSLTIKDDGCGITDFRALVTVAESDWSHETMDSERPFGIGFFSLCFAADSLCVQSKGKEISFSTEDLIEKRPIVIKSSRFVGATHCIDGTWITLYGCRLSEQAIHDALVRYARGFPIPVFWQGMELPRPDQQAVLTGEQTPVGFIHVPGIHSDKSVGVSYRGRVYCQGLPVKVEGFSENWQDKPNPVIHVEHRRYTPRMPDRDTLIDSDQTGEEFCQALQSVWREHLVDKKNELPAEDYVRIYWDIARKTKCFDLMADVPVLPAAELWCVGETPILIREGESYSAPGRAVTREEVESGAVRLFTDFDIKEDWGDDFLRLMWAEKAKALFVTRWLPEGHWVKLFLHDLAKEKMEVREREVAKARFSSCWWCNGEIKLVDDLTVTIAGATYRLTEAVAVMSCESHDITYLVPKDIETSAGYVLRQASTYTYDDMPCDMEFDMDSDRFNDLLAILAGEPAEKTLGKCLCNGHSSEKTNLRNRAFRVLFDEAGRATITPT